MPVRIPLYEQQTVPRGTPGPRASGQPVSGAVGAALQDVGATVSQIGAQINEARREAEFADSLGRATAELTELELRYEQDPDFKTSPQRFQQDADAIHAKYSDAITDGVVRQAFSTHYAKLAQAKGINIRKYAFGRERDYNIASLDGTLDTYAKAAAGAKHPVERGFVENQARIAIAGMQRGGWITSVDAGKRERQFQAKVQEHELLRDMQADPSAMADRMATDPEYGSALDPVHRERLLSQALQRSETTRARQEREAEKARKARGDELLMDAYARMDSGKLTRAEVENMRPFIEPHEYKSLLKSFHEGRTQRDDPAAFADLQTLMLERPQEALTKAYQYHRNGLIKNETLASIRKEAVGGVSDSGPKNEYQRSRAFITSSLSPSDISSDPAPKARLGLAMREFDDFAAAGKRTDEELRKKSEEVVQRFSLIDMNALAQRTGIGSRNSPQTTLEQIRVKAQQTDADYKAGRITQQEFNKRMADLNEARKAAEKANGGK